MLDPILSLAFSMHSNKGVYALLLGSGVSRAAGIPTGWEVTLDLIRKLAHIKGDNCEPDPPKWYAETFGEEADYSKLLQLVAKTSSERNSLLKAYFEPNEEERQQNIKTPTNAHKAIASLVARGYIKVIVTTNFDRLMEKALEEAGVTPNVISTIDAIQGSIPITHTSCTQIKVHGDYLDTRIKNTQEELSVYDEQLNALLDRVLDEFGLIICGWSGEWDIALRDAIQRCKSRRYTTYWTVKDDLSEKARDLANSRSAEIIRIQSADSFFSDLSEKLHAISEFERPHPLSAQVAIATIKRYLEDEKYKIRLHDLVTQATERLFESISPKIYSIHEPVPEKDELVRRITQYESKTEILQAMMITGAYWGDHSTASLFVKSLERLTDHQKLGSGSYYPTWVHLQLYPALILLCSAGLAALAADNYEMLATLLLKPLNKHGDRGKEPLLLSIFPEAVLEQAVGRLLPNMDRRYTPTSDHLVEVLFSPLKDYILEQTDLEAKFDRLEYLISLSIHDHRLTTEGHSWGPIGRFGWRFRHNRQNHIANQIQNEIDTEGEKWKPIKAGFFGGSIERAKVAQSKLLEQLQHTH